MKELTILTGASRGLGRAMLDELLAIGKETIVVLRQDDETIPSRVPRILCDFSLCTDPAYATSFLERLTKMLDDQQCDTLTFVNNAGVVTPIGQVGGVDASGLIAAVSTNFLAPAMISDTCAAFCAARKLGLRTLNISSGAANSPIPGWAAYCSTKAAAKMWMNVMAAEGQFEVVNIDPGVMDTGMQTAIRGATREAFPIVDTFIGYADSGKLKSAHDVAREIVGAYFGTPETGA